MDAIGEILKNAREMRKLTYREVTKETNISPVYLQALEEEDFEKLPGETYIVGFLKNYAEYLKLDVEEIVNGYKGHKIGESQTPLEELTKPTSSVLFVNFLNLFSKNKNILYVGGIGVFLILTVWIFSAIFSSDISVMDSDSIKGIKTKFAEEIKDDKLENIKNLKLSDNRGYILVYRKEAFQFLVDNKEVLIILKDVKSDSAEIEAVPGKISHILDIEKPAVLKIEGYSREIVLTLKGLTKNRAKIFVMLGGKIAVEPGGEAAVKRQASSPGRTVVALDEKNLKIVFEAEFTQKTYLELYLDGVKKKKGLVSAGVRERWEATENIQFKIGNAGGLNATINGKSYNFGAPGQIANKVITWRKDISNPNLYHIVVRDW